MKLVTVLLPEAYLEGLDELVRANMYQAGVPSYGQLSEICLGKNSGKNAEDKTFRLSCLNKPISHFLLPNRAV